MPLNLGRRRGNGEDFISSLRYSAKTNIWSTWDDTNHQMMELPELIGIFDFETVRCGWLLFEQGQPPELVWDIAGVAATRPSKAHKRGFSVLIFIEHVGLRELCSNGAGVCTAIEDVFDEYERDPKSRRGLLPVLQAGPAKLVESTFGSFYEPTFELIDWCPRPEELPARPASEPPRAKPPTLFGRRGAPDLDDEIPF